MPTMRFSEALRSAAREKNLSLDPSFIRSVEEYSELLQRSRRPEVTTLNERDRDIVLGVISDRAVNIARERGTRIALSTHFDLAIVEFKGPTPPPWDTCEYAAVSIARNMVFHFARMSESFRRNLGGQAAVR